MTWWKSASLEQRLAQIDGGIECGMTAEQMAMVSGCDQPRNLYAFAIYHGRHFGRSKSSTRTRAHGEKLSAKAAYDRGLPVNFWASGPQSAGRVVDGDFDEASL